MTTSDAMGDEQAAGQREQLEQLEAQLDAAEAFIENAIMRAGWERPLDLARPDSPGVANGLAYGRGRFAFLLRRSLELPAEVGDRRDRLLLLAAAGFTGLGALELPAERLTDRRERLLQREFACPPIEGGESLAALLCRELVHRLSQKRTIAPKP